MIPTTPDDDPVTALDELLDGPRHPADDTASPSGEDLAAIVRDAEAKYFGSA